MCFVGCYKHFFFIILSVLLSLNFVFFFNITIFSLIYLTINKYFISLQKIQFYSSDSVFVRGGTYILPNDILYTVINFILFHHIAVSPGVA